MTENSLTYKVFTEFVKGRKIAIAGVGVSNLPLIEFFTRLGGEVVCCDRKTADKFDKKTLDLLNRNCRSVFLGEDYLDHFGGCDMILRSPGIRYDRPEFVKAVQNGAVLTGEIELFVAFCPCKTIGITGSDGKTTTTTLIYEMLKSSGRRCFIGGNIGAPLLNRIEDIGADDVAVIELSSFQLHNMRVSPDVAVITNIAPNHLDYHTDYQEYQDAKKNIYSNGNTKLVVNYDNYITREIGLSHTEGETIFFSKTEKTDGGVRLNEDFIYIGEEPMIRTGDIRIPGIHNVENYMAAIGAVGDMVSREHIKKVAVNFGGVAHRMELVREKDGVKYYNDSIASSPTRTAAGLRAFDDKIILIAGGYDKHIPYTDFGEVVADCVKHLILIGDTAAAIGDSTRNALERRGETMPIEYCTTFREAVTKACLAADKGDRVVLSPASASFDMFKNFEERGNTFKDLVNKL